MTHKMLQLPYDLNALEPRMSADTLMYHHGKHLQTYMDNVNRLTASSPYEDMSLKELVCNTTGALFNNAAQAWNHILFFKQLSPKPTPMGRDLCQAIQVAFGSFADFKEEFTKAALGLFGSGWVWLAADKQMGLHILAEPNAGNPLTRGMNPLFCLDVWEHAYYLDYQNRRADYIENFWQLLDWGRVENRLMRNDCTLYY